MPQDVYLYERLVIGLEGEPSREQGEAGDTYSLRLYIKNPIGSPGSDRRPPGMELWTEDGGVFEPSNDAWAEPMLPDTEDTRLVQFRIPADVTPRELVLGPGQPEEVHIPLTQAAAA